MSAGDERAKEVAAQPHVKKWVKRLRKLCADMPPEVWVFVGAGTVCVMAKDKDGNQVYRPAGGTDQDYLVASERHGDATWDGGDW